jgi:hypothetical protein
MSGSINKRADGLMPTSLTIYQKVTVPHSTNPVLYSYFLCKVHVLLTWILRCVCPLSRIADGGDGLQIWNAVTDGYVE